MFRATIQHVEKREDEIMISVEYADGKEGFMKDYRFVHMVDINTSFDETIRMELKRINDLDSGYKTMKLREGEAITLTV